MSSHLFWRGDRRMEAENYLSSGYGLKLAIEERAVGWRRLGALANVWHPSRLKGILLDERMGTPFLAATQVFDIRPVVRKWLSLDKTDDASERYLAEGTILVTCSGSVGRSTLTQTHHTGILITHDLLRVNALESKHWGWIYAYLRSPQAKAMMTGAKYGHIINHIEISHLSALPVPMVTDAIAASFQKQTEEILTLRNKAHALTLEAEALFEKALGPVEIKDWGESGFTTRARLLFQRNRRFEASRHNPGASKILAHLAKHGREMNKLGELGFDIWVPGRYKRINAVDGVPYFDSSDILETNPDALKRYADCAFGDKHRGRVKKEWLLMPCSGQVYGIIGSAVLAGDYLDGQVVSNHVVRFAPKPSSKVRTGYLLTSLTHPKLGRPLVKALAFGSSVPEIDTDDLCNLGIVRLTSSQEDAIADLAEESAALRARADVREREMAAEAGRLIDRFLAGDVVNFVVTMPAVKSPTMPALLPDPIPEHALVRLRKTRKVDGLKAGSEGTVVHVYADGAAYEVEFPKPKGAPVMLTLKAEEIEELT